MDPRSIVAVRLSNSVTDVDDDNTNARNMLVVGDLSSAPYSGTLVMANWRRDISPGLTVDEFEPSAATPPPGDDNADASDPVRHDAIVFQLPDNVSFKEGETISVTLRSRVSSHGSPLRETKHFSFRIRSQGSATERLEVVNTNPAAGATRISSRLPLKAAFNRAASSQGLDAAITIRAAQSGVHSGVQTYFPRVEGTGNVREVAQRLGAGDAFLPGERVEIAWSSAITEASPATPGNAARLRPHILRFQVDAGEVAGGWLPAAIPGGLEAPVTVLAAELDRDAPGVEFIVLTESSLVLFRQAEPPQTRIWTSSELAIGAQGGVRPVAAITYDLDSGAEADGRPEVVVLLSGERESQLRTFAIGDSGALAARGKTVTFTAGNAAGIFAADLDGSGKPELLVPRSEPDGSLTLFELRLIPPDPDDINPADPATLMPRPGFQRLDASLPGFEPARRIEAADLNGDGRLDLIAEGSSGLVLYQNLGTGRTQYAVRLTTRIPTNAAPRAWTVADLDDDGDQDLLLWDGEEARLFRNERDGEGQSSLLLGTPPASVPVPGLELGGAAQVEALDLDGRERLDLAVLETTGELRLHLAAPGSDLAFTPTALAGADGAARGLAIADFDGGAGLDIVSLAGSEARLVLAEGVDPPSSGVQTEFRLVLDQAASTGDTFRVLVVADAGEPFSGYSLALDYDESILTYRGFIRPDAFPEGKSSFTLCPDANLQGCAGHASAVMVFTQATQHPGAENVLLGTFLFRKPVVSEPEITVIELAAFDRAPGQTIDNTLRVMDSAASVNVPVDSLGEPLSLAVEPPPPVALTAECTVLERADTSLSGRVTWRSPAGTSYSNFAIDIAGRQETILSGATFSQQITTSLTGAITIAVRGLGPTGATEAVAECVVVGIHRPGVECMTLSETQNRFTWTLSAAHAPVERFVLYRNGGFLATVGSAVREFTDASPNPNAAELYEVSGVIGAVEGPRGSCAGGPVGDPDPESTIPPRINAASLASRPLASSPNVLELRWTNGEGYDRDNGLDVTLERTDRPATVDTRVLPGTQTQFNFPGDEARGGVAPGQYEFTLRARSLGVPSETVRSARVNVPVPSLTVAFTCAVDAAGDLRLRWDPVWAGYSELKIVYEHRVDGAPQGGPVEIPLALDATMHVIPGLAPVGEYTFRLVASYAEAASLPDELVPGPGGLERTCALDFAAGLRLGVIEGGVGLTRLEIPVRATVLGRLTGFRFALEYPDFLEIDADSGLVVDFPGGEKSLSVVAGDESGTRKAQVVVSGIDAPADGDGDGVADEERVLATLIASVPARFDLPGGSLPLRFRGVSAMTLPEVGEVPIGAEDGSLVIHRRYVSVDLVEAAAGTTTEVRVPVRGTFDAAVPDYTLIGFTLHIRWNPEELELLPVRSEDQAGSAIFGRGTLILPNQTTFAEARSRGELTVPWLAINFSNPEELEFLEPGINLILLIVRFRPLAPAGAPASFAPIDFVFRPEDCPAPPRPCNPTVFLPTVSIPNQPDLQGFLGGGVHITSDAMPLRLNAVNPSHGAFLGGNVAELQGSGFLGGAEQMAIHFLLQRGGVTTTLPVTQVLESTASRIRFRVPDSTLRSLSAPATPADIRLTAPNGTALLTNGYTFEPPRITSAEPAGGPASGGQLLVVRGAGLAAGSRASFTFAAPGGSFPAEVVSVASDGSELRLVTPDLRGHEGQRATVEVEAPGVGVISLRDAYEVRPDGTGGPAFRVLRIDRDRAFICGGQDIILEGEGFRAPLRVDFGPTASPGVTLLDARRARVVVPAVAEGTGQVTIRATNAGGASASLSTQFTFEHPAPHFVRGDVNESGSVSVTDGVVLSDLLLGRLQSWPRNRDAADANDDGVIDGGDVTAILAYLFGDGAEPSEPFHAAGLDATPDALTSCP